MNATIRLVVVVLLMTANVRAPAQQTIPLVGIARVAVRVKDVAAARAFYLSLGFQQSSAPGKDDGSSATVIKLNDHQFLELYPTTPKEAHACFLRIGFEADDLEAVHDDYSSHGLKPSEITTDDSGNSHFTLPGPLQFLGSNAVAQPQPVEFLQYQPGSRQSEDKGKQLGPERIADRLIGVSLAFKDAEDAREFYFNDLNFKQLPNQPLLLHLPGISGQYIAITPAAEQGTHARIILDASTIARAERILRHEHIPFIRVASTPGGQPAAISFLDPDGNDVLVEGR